MGNREGGATMSIERMADRTLPLAERVAAMGLLDWDKDNADGRWDARDVLIADIAATDRLARAASAWAFTRDAALDRLYAAPDPIRGTVAGDDEADSEAAYREYEDAVDSYRARMAQGVGR